MYQEPNVCCIGKILNLNCFCLQNRCAHYENGIVAEHLQCVQHQRNAALADVRDECVQSDAQWRHVVRFQVPT